jgi:two-component system, NarL family, sensor kinase
LPRYVIEHLTSKQSGIQARLDLPSELERLPELTELALFRILQESLTNVHRHSSSSVEIQLKTTDRNATLTVRDFGHGMSGELLHGFDPHRRRLGVGLRGMRERVNDLGGQLDIKSDQHGTTVIVTVPMGGTSCGFGESPGQAGKELRGIEDAELRDRRTSPPSLRRI